MKSSRWFHPLLQPVVAFGSLPLALAAADPAPAPKPYVLFMGTDLIVERDKKLYRIEDVSGSTFKIHVDGREVLVPTRNRQTGLQLSPGLKLTGAAVQLDQLKSGPAFTPENDPMEKLKTAAGNAASMQAVQDLAQNSLIMHQDAVVGAQRAYDNSAHPEERAANGAMLEQAKLNLATSQAQYNSVTNTMASDFVNVGAGAHQMQLAAENFDAMEVSFKISSPVELTSPYMVVLFRFHDPAAKPGVDGMVIHAQALDPVDASPRYVRVLRGGLPIGFKYVDCAVHIYDRGREVATNASEKRVDLTRDEAQLYIVMEYTAANKTATAPAGAVAGSLPRAQRQKLTPDQLTRTVYAKVAKDATLLGAYTDADCNNPLNDAGTAAALHEVFFRPALDKGKPVDGVAKVRLVDF